MDIFQNSIRAHASSVELDIHEDIKNNQFNMTIKDNGIGMDMEMVQQATDPFFTTRTTRKVGLGLSLLKQNVERTGGTFSLDSKTGIGTVVSARFIFDHPDRPASGDITGVFLLTAMSNPCIDFIYEHGVNQASFVISTPEIKEMLGEIPISHPEVYPYLRETINENITNLSAN